MNFGVWIFALLFVLMSIMSPASAADSCPTNFKLDENKLCTAARTIRGECPQGSQYSANINKCVYGAKG